MSLSPTAVREALALFAGCVNGPGGAVAVLHNGKLLDQYVWGYSDMGRRIPMTSGTMMPICSISKQMLCMAIAELAREEKVDIWDQLSKRMEQILGRDLIQQSGLRVQDLCNNQSGLRDYWAMTDVWGAFPEGVFSIARDGPPMIQSTKSFHFESGTEYSYSNTNFHLVARMLEHVCNEPLASLLSRLVFSPAHMKTAVLCPDTAKHPLPCVGYEGSESVGFFAAVNNIEWSGDAGIVASLDDMVAYEQYLDRNWEDKTSAYHAISQPQSFRDGTPSRYGFGLGSQMLGGKKVIGHGGALRGFRSSRVHMPSERLSVVVMFNHEPNNMGSGSLIVEALLGISSSEDATSQSITPNPQWAGTYLDADTHLAITIQTDKPGKILLSYTGSETLNLKDESRASSSEAEAEIDGDVLSVKRLRDNRVIKGLRVQQAERTRGTEEDIAGEYYCESARSTFRCAGKGLSFYGSFDGFLGVGPARGMRKLGENVWSLSSSRAMDAPAPGNWTLVFLRDDQGHITAVTIGCWLARNLNFVKQS